MVVGGDFQGLGIARSIGRRRAPVCVIDDECAIAPYSRYTTHAMRVKDLREEQATIAAVLEAGHRFNLKGWVLYPTRDETVAAFSHHRDTLADWFRVPTPDWNVVQWAWDKRNTYRLAQQLGIGIPRTWYPQSEEELRHIDAEFPLVIKPAIKEHFIYTTKVKAWRAANREELSSQFRQAAGFVPRGELIIQELIPGGSQQLYGYCAFFKSGRALGTMVTQYQRQHPPLFGRSCTYVQTIDQPIIEELAERFLAAIDYYGLVEVEFKLDPRDGNYKLLDVNARTWGYHSLGAAAGVDFSQMLFADQLGEPVRPSRASAGIGWIRLVTDLPVGLLAVVRRQLGLWAYLRSVKRCSAEAVFSAEDPMPSLVETALIPYLAYKRGF